MRRRKNEIAKGYIFASILHNISETHSKWTNDLFHRMRHEGFVSHVRTKNRRMLHIYSMAVRPDKNDMAIEPEGMDRKEKGKGRLVKEGRGGNFANGTDFERQTQTSHTPPPTLLFTPFSPTSEKPPFIRSYHLSSRSLFFFCIIFTHRTKSLIFFPHTSFARSYHTLPLWQIVILQPLSSHIPFFSPPLHPFCSSSIPWQYKVPLDWYVTDEFLFGRILTVGKIYIDIYSSQNDCRVMFLADGLFHFPVPAVSGVPRLVIGKESHYVHRTSPARHQEVGSHYR